MQYFINSYFGYGKQRLILLFTFLQKIHDIIEIKLGEESFEQLNLINPEYLTFSKNSKNYFYSLIDYSSPETKLMSIYNYIECIIYDINRKKWEKNKNGFFKCIANIKLLNRLTTRTYKFWEIINYIAFIIINIILIIDYYKSRDATEIIFNEIDNRKKLFITRVWAIAHISILFLIILYWFFSRLKIDYFFSITLYCNDYFKENEKLRMEKKANLLKKDYSDFYINSFFPERNLGKIIDIYNDNNIFQFVSKLFEFLYINYIKVYLYTFKTIYPFIFSIIFLGLSFKSQIFFIVPLFLLFNLSDTLLTIVLLFKNQSITLLSITIFFIVILYIFSWFGFFFLPRMFEYEPVDKNNELINDGFMKERICSSTIPCILYFLNFGFRDNFMDMNLISFKNEISYYLIQYFFNLFLYVFIHLIFDNIFLVTIGNAFDEMKKEMNEREKEIEDVCFICGKTKNDCIGEYKQDFEEHIKKHDIWKYIRYICGIILKNKEQYTDEEYYVWKQIKYKKLDWFPKNE